MTRHSVSAIGEKPVPSTISLVSKPAEIKAGTTESARGSGAYHRERADVTGDASGGKDTNAVEMLLRSTEVSATETWTPKGDVGEARARAAEREDNLAALRRSAREGAVHVKPVLEALPGALKGN